MTDSLSEGLQINMMDKDFFEKSNKIFVNLLNLANEELGSKGLKVEPSVIIGKVISPLKDLYFKNLTELLGSFLKKTHDMQS